MAKQEVSPERDSSLGLIFRLNGLWSKVDYPAEKGDYDSWNNILDRIFSNLDYKDVYASEKDAEGKIINIKMDDDDFEIYHFLSKKIFIARMNYKKAKVGKQKVIFRKQWFQNLFKKDRWLRKYMQRRKLYLKEVEYSPGTSLWG